jgi:putative colanic acid biosynthesis UDP-glucose lipid carrier transferase
MIQKHSSKLNLFLSLIDLSILWLSGFIAYYFYLHNNTFSSSYLQSLLIMSLLFLWLSSVFGLYRPWRGESVLLEIKKIAQVLAVGFLVLIFWWFALKAGANYSRMWVLLFLSLSFVIFVIFRIILRQILKKIRKKGFNQKHIILLGSGNWTNYIYNKINKSQDIGFSIAGVYKNTQEIKNYSDLNNIDQVWITMQVEQAKEISGALEELGSISADIRWLPDTSSFNLINHSISHLDNLPIIDLLSSPMQGISVLLKAVEDKVLAFLILLLISPIMLFVAIGIKLSSRGPILYKQSRISWNGKSFNMLKFRSMPIDCEKDTGCSLGYKK